MRATRYASTMPTNAASLPLAGWTVIGLRAREQQATPRRAARRLGADYLALPGLALHPADDPAAARQDLRKALACPRCIFTSPAAVRFAAALLPLGARRVRAIAIGSGTAAALRRAGVVDIEAPRGRMRSEEVLALPALSPPPSRVGLVTAPGGRGAIAAALRAAGAALQVAEVYRRGPARLTARALNRLAALSGPRTLLLSSGEALVHVLDALDEASKGQLRAARVLVASPRLANLARAQGFDDVLETGSPLPRVQLAALCRHVIPEAFR